MSVICQQSNRAEKFPGGVRYAAGIFRMGIGQSAAGMQGSAAGDSAALGENVNSKGVVLWNGGAGQAFALSESMVSDVSNTVGDGDAF